MKIFYISLILFGINTIADEFIVIDVRTPEEFKSGHIEESSNVEWQTISSIIDEVKNSEKKVSKLKDKSGYETPWIMTETKNIKKFTISRNHELIKKVRNDNNDKENFDLMLREIEKSIPNYIEQDKKIIETEKDKIMQPKIISEFINLIKDNNKESAKEKLKLRYPNYHEFVESLDN